MRIYLVRHGESQSNVDPALYGEMADHAILLGERAHEQARAAGAALRTHLDERKKQPTSEAELLGYHLRMWNSPYVRTRETAADLAAELGNRVTSRRENVLLSEQQFGLFDHLVVPMLENRSFDNLCGYRCEHDQPKHFIPDEDRVFLGVAGRDDLENDDGREPPRAYRVQKAPWGRLEDMYAPYPSAGEFYTPNMSRQVYSADTVSGNLDELPTENLMKGVRRWDEKADLLIPSPYYSESGCVSVVGT